MSATVRRPGHIHFPDNQNNILNKMKTVRIQIIHNQRDHVIIYRQIRLFLVGGFISMNDRQFIMIPAEDQK